ncbi:MAG: hypothetical protein HQK56_15195 [Deltaproteobacteria bacterium]|nr:hypothetical protein [Deltaproteobacteria bacterium]
MASVDRDQKLAAAILELAETRSIARALRFAGYGVEYTGAEEISHLPEAQGNQATLPTPNEAPTNNSSRQPDNGNGNNGGHKAPPEAQNELPHPGGNGGKSSQSQSGNGKGAGNNKGNGGNGNGDARITNKQLAYILTLGKNLGMDSKGLDAQSVEIFGVKVAHLKMSEASSFIKNLNGFNN